MIPIKTPIGKQNKNGLFGVFGGPCRACASQNKWMGKRMACIMTREHASCIEL
jgi:hypothetical protein